MEYKVLYEILNVKPDNLIDANLYIVIPYEIIKKYIASINIEDFNKYKRYIIQSDEKLLNLFPERSSDNNIDNTSIDQIDTDNTSIDNTSIDQIDTDITSINNIDNNLNKTETDKKLLTIFPEHSSAKSETNKIIMNYKPNRNYCGYCTSEISNKGSNWIKHVNSKNHMHHVINSVGIEEFIENPNKYVDRFAKTKAYDGLSIFEIIFNDYINKNREKLSNEISKNKLYLSKLIKAIKILNIDPGRLLNKLNLNIFPEHSSDNSYSFNVKHESDDDSD